MVDRSAVADDRVREAVKTNDLLHNHRNVLRCVTAFPCRNKVGFLAESVSPDIDAVITIRGWQFDNCISGNVMPWPMGGRLRV
jgi:hypothetical protein